MFKNTTTGPDTSHGIKNIATVLDTIHGIKNTTAGLDTSHGFNCLRILPQKWTPHMDLRIPPQG